MVSVHLEISCVHTNDWKCSFISDSGNFMSEVNTERRYWPQWILCCEFCECSTVISNCFATLRYHALTVTIKKSAFLAKLFLNGFAYIMGMARSDIMSLGHFCAI